MFYLETGSTDPSYNLAFEQVILENRMADSYVILWKNDNTVVVGQNQNAAEEINREFVIQHGIRVVRRMTGGGAVYHDLGNINYSFITDCKNAGYLEKERFTDPVVNALKELGLNAEASGRNDILVNGRKVSGTAERIFKNRVLHHGTLLFDTNPLMLSGALNPDPEKFRSKGVKSVKSRVGNIRAELKKTGKDIGLDEFFSHIRSCLTTGSGAVSEEAMPDIAEMKEIERLKKEKYDSFEWTYGRSPKYDYRNKMRFRGGSVEIRARVEEGMIKEAVFLGDFLGKKPLTELEKQLESIEFSKSSIDSVLKQYDLTELFGDITREELLSLM